MERAWDTGLIVVAAAGNMGPGEGSITAPEAVEKLLRWGLRILLVKNRGISGRGPTNDCIIKPDVVAPGNAVISCANRNDNMPYTIKSGTSMSTPVVSGAIALLLEREPWLTNFEIKKRLRRTAKDLGAVQGTNQVTFNLSNT